MNVQAALKTQYHAALAMLKATIDQCPDELWAGGNHPVAFWRVAYHTLFFTHLYLQPDEASFRPWEHHREEGQFLGPLPWPPHRQPKVGPPYTKAQILEYWGVCDAMVDGAVDALDLSAPQCGFPWYNLPKLDHQINNIRHIQHHAALLAGRLRQTAGTDIQWVGRV
jgi:hypothetical protein